MVCPPFPTKGILIPLHFRDYVVVTDSKKNGYASLPNSGSSSHFISTLLIKQEALFERFCRIWLCCVGAWSAEGLLTPCFPSWWHHLPQRFWRVFLVSDMAGEGCGF